MMRPARWLALVLLFAGAEAAHAATARPHGVRPCADRAEPPIGAPDRNRDLVAGPFRFISGKGHIGGQKIGRGSLWVWKAPVAAAADRRVTVTIDRGDRRRARFSGPRSRRLRDGYVSMTYAACAAETPTFTGDSTVGPYTAWAGSLMTSRRPFCLRLTVKANGDEPRRVKLPLGRRRCGT